MTPSAITTFNADQRQILLDTVCKGCTTENFLFMLELARKYKLDPFARQIYCTKVGIIISRDGLLAIAHRSGDFDGMQTTFEHDEKGNIISSTTRVWRKLISHPFEETAYWSEYARDTEVWNKYKHAMMQKCSERMALSKAYAITGLYAEEELSPNPKPPQDAAYIDVEPLPVEPQPKLTAVPEPGASPEPKPEQQPKNIYTRQQAESAISNMRLIGMKTDGLLERAALPDGMYNGDIITGEWNRQKEEAR